MGQHLVVEVGGCFLHATVVSLTTRGDPDEQDTESCVAEACYARVTASLPWPPVSMIDADNPLCSKPPHWGTQHRHSINRATQTWLVHSLRAAQIFLAVDRVVGQT